MCRSGWTGSSPNTRRKAEAHTATFSVVGNDQEIAAIAAAISDEARFYATGPDFGRIMTSLGKDAEVFRATINIPGRRRPLRHLVAVSEELSQTRSGGNPSARRTVLCDDDPAFLLYRIGARFGLPVLPEWSEWFASELERHKAIEPLMGLGCRPMLVKGTKKRFLGWIGHGLKRDLIRIPHDGLASPWRVQTSFQTSLEAAADAAA